MEERRGGLGALNVSYILLTVSLFHRAYGVGGVTEKLAGVVGPSRWQRIIKVSDRNTYKVRKDKILKHFPRKFVDCVSVS